MLDTIIESVLGGKLDSVLVVKWLNNESIEEASDDCILLCCNRNEFVTYFLSYLRRQTEGILQSNTTALQLLQHQGTPERSSSTRRKHHRSISDPTRETDRNDSLSVKTDRHRSHESPNRDKKKTGRKVKTKLFADDKKDVSASSDESRLSSGVDRLVLSSTPNKNGIKFSEYPGLPLSSPVTPHSRSFNNERCDTPRMSHRHSRSQDKSVSLGDYLVTAQTKSSKKKRASKNSSNDDSETKPDLDLSNSEIFPEIGARKSSSLRSERRRIKPTAIDKSTTQKSFSLNSFNSESFQQPSPLAFEENIAFRTTIQPASSNNFDAERNILKQERHKLMEKFNILNTSAATKLVTTPQIKITQKDLTEKDQVFVQVDCNKVVLKEKIDILVDIYDVLIKNNLILSINTEIYFLISILLSKQNEDDYMKADSKLKDNLVNYLLKPIHNSTYFAVRSLWHQRVLLEVILDKNSLKTLGENKKVRSFCPDLAKFLLNSYGLKCEAESNMDKSKVPENRASNGIVCFNFETDNAENFSSALSFHNFKKQRDMFYEILRWYNESGASRSSMRARVRALLSAGPTASCHAHLAALLAAHALAECRPATAQESKLSKLQRRFTCPSAPESHRLPRFTDKEQFYKDFILYADNESFRVHLKDALSSEIVALDGAPVGIESSNSTDTSQDYLQLSKKLGLLAKFLGYLTSLPYTAHDVTMKTGVVNTASKEQNFVVPKEKVLENNIALRNYSQPAIDLHGLLTSAYVNGRLCITLPWIAHYLSMIDYTTLRLKYYQKLLQILFQIYDGLKTETQYKKNTIIFLKSMLGWLFDLPHFPQEMFYEQMKIDIGISNDGIDSCDIIDESILFELCPFLKDLTVLLSTSRVCQEQKDMGSFRHITPVSLGVNPEDRIRNKEKELQARLEEEFLKSQPSSTRRVVELVVERVAAGAARQLRADTLQAARLRLRARGAELARGKDRSELRPALEALYASEMATARAEALNAGSAGVRARVRGALSALLPAAPAPLRAAAAARATHALHRHLRDHADVLLCKDIDEEIKSLLAGETTPTAKTPPIQLTSPNVDCTSAANAVIALKELICVLLDNEEPTEDSNAVLSMCAACCSPQNMFCRPPTQRAILRLSVDYCVVFVSRKPTQVSEAFLNSLHGIWNICCPDRKRCGENGEEPSSPVGEDGARGLEEGRAPEPKSDADPTDDQLEFFDRILCPRNIIILSTTTARSGDVWAALATVLVFLLRHDYLGEDSLTEQCLAVYRQDWPQNILESLSSCMRAVSARWSRCSGGKFTLFLDFLAEFCGDLAGHALP
ncbi:uncharacterized protein dlt [Epargyreus clarus]|uniref:uncharacterized protein dlt n=1 Tax=Epargyreus clarus TaxID=520877 RepID=UPI003C2E5D2E